MDLSLNLIKRLRPEGRIAVMLSNGMDSKVVLEMLKMVHDNITTINLIRPTGRDISSTADVKLSLVDGSGEYERVCNTILHNIIPYFDQVWCGENAVPNIEWFKNHEDVPTRGTKEIDGNYYSPFLFHDKAVIVALAKKYNIDVSDTVSCIVHQDHHCKQCWFCKEREYGYVANGLEVEW